MRILPHVYTLGLVQFVSLIKFCVTCKTQGRDAVIESLQAATLPIAQLIAVGGNHSPVLNAAVHAWRITHSLQ
jgi:hypothetical protein